MRQCFLLFSCLWFYVVLSGDEAAAVSLSNHTMIFISGIPQSGTSLLQQIFSVTPRASTMVDKCFEKHSSKCSNWNNEGQWLLGWGQTDVSKSAAAILNAGSLCPLNTSESTRSSSSGGNEIKESMAFIRRQWEGYWDIENNILLVEKSPQNLLKMSLISSIFSDYDINNSRSERSSNNTTSNRLKFLVVLKHPSTLNIALPKRTEWLYSLEYTGNGEDRAKVKKRLLQDKINKNFEHFIAFMDSSLHVDTAKGRSCQLGWLNAMEKLETIISSRENIFDVRILRYEDFAAPHALCLKLMLFAFDSYPTKSYYADATRQVCDKYFSDSVSSSKKAAVSSSSSKGTKDRRGRSSGSEPRRQRKPYAAKTERGSGRRQLRLRSSIAISSSNEQPSAKRTTVTKPASDHKRLDFSVTTVDSSVKDRLKSFQKALKKTSSAYQKEISRLERRLNRFGYSFESKDILSYHLTHSNVFDKYDIMKV